MTAVVLEVTNVTRNLDGSIDLDILWNGGAYNKHFASQADLNAFAASYVQTVDEAVLMLCLYWLTRNAALTDDSKIVNKPITVDPAGPPLVLSVFGGPRPLLCFVKSLLM